MAARGGFGVWVLALAWLALCVGLRPSLAVADVVEVASAPGQIVGASEERVLGLGSDSGLLQEGSLLGVEPPQTRVTARPTSANGRFIVASTEASFEFTSTAHTATFECRLDEGDWTACTSPHSYSGVSEGLHYFSVASTDTTTGERDPDPAVAYWWVDLTPPSAPVLRYPVDGAIVLDDTPDLRWWEASDSPLGIDFYEVWLDGAKTTVDGGQDGWAPSSPLEEERMYTWRVVAVDPAGNTTSSPTRSFEVDFTRPEPFSLLSPLAGETVASARPTFAWTASSDDIAGYDVWIDGGPPTRVAGGGTTFTPASDLPDGDHWWWVNAVDIFGRNRALDSIPFRIDTRPPVAVLGITTNPTFAGDSVSFDAGASTARVGRIVRHEWDLDGDGSYELDTGPVATTSRTYDAITSFVVRLRVTDAAGRSDSTAVTLKVTPRPQPGPPGVSIEDGASYTNSPDVTLAAIWPFFATHMLVSNDGGFGGATPTDVFAGFAWRLDTSRGERLPKTVYVRFIGGLAGNETYQDDIILDETAPRIVSATATSTSGTAATAATAAASAQAKQRYRLRIRAKDNVSGIARIQITQNRRRPGKWKRYRPRLTIRAAASRSIYVRVRDRATNRSRWRKVTRLSD